MSLACGCKPPFRRAPPRATQYITLTYSSSRFLWQALLRRLYGDCPTRLYSCTYVNTSLMYVRAAMLPGTCKLPKGPYYVYQLAHEYREVYLRLTHLFDHQRRKCLHSLRTQPFLPGAPPGRPLGRPPGSSARVYS